MQQLVFLNGEIVPYEDARVHIDDRGFTFADGVYEVVRVYDGRPFELKRHLERLQRSATALRLHAFPEWENLSAISAELLRRQELKDAQIYIQLTRGAAPRAHAFAPDLRPTLVVAARPVKRPPRELIERGAAAITVPDDRWARCDVKAINLTPNILARQRAVEAGAYEAIFIRDGTVTDCSSSNVFAVLDGALVTAPRSNYILAGITREVVLEQARTGGISVREEVFRAEDLHAAEEIFVTSTTTEVLAITTLDGVPVGDGEPGPVTKQCQEWFASRTRPQ